MQNQSKHNITFDTQLKTALFGSRTYPRSVLLRHFSCVRSGHHEIKNLRAALLTVIGIILLRTGT